MNTPHLAIVAQVRTYHVLRKEKKERKKERTFSTEKKKKKNFRIIVDQVGFQQFDKVGR